MSAQQEQQIVDECPISHFSMIPNIIDDMDLSPHEYRLYGHLKRVTGESAGGKCWQSTDTLAKHCCMSAGTISKAKKRLEQLGLIRIEEVPGKPGRKYHRITIVNIWQRNAEYFQSSSKKLQSSPDETKNNPSFTKNPLPPTPTAGDDAPAFLTFDQLLKDGEKATNRVGFLRWYVVTLFPAFEPELDAMKNKGYAYVGKMARDIGGMGYCMKLLWQAAGQRITGDPLRYVLKMKQNGRSGDNGHKPVEQVELATGLGQPLTEEYIASLGLLDD